MSNLQEQQALWRLAPGEVLSLPIGPGARELSVSQGRLWLTGQGSAQAPAQDIWLQAGDSLHLASGSQWVVEAWPAAAFQLLVPPSSCKIKAAVPVKPPSRAPSWASLQPST